MQFAKRFALFVLIVPLSGCLLTKAVTVPMRVGGAIMSATPVVGNTADGLIDTTADLIDEVPL